MRTHQNPVRTMKSGRAVKSPRRYGESPPPTVSTIAQPQPLYERQLTLEVFLERLYREIHEAAQNEVSPTVRDSIRRYICEAGTQRYHDSLHVPEQMNLRNTRRTGRTAQSAVLRTALQALQTFSASRSAETTDHVGYPILAICLHPQTFRDSLTTNDTTLPWNARLNAISRQKDSLELFAKTRGLTFREQIEASKKYFDYMLSTCAQRPQAIGANKRPHSIFIDDDLTELHDNTHGALFPHLWALTGPGEPATRCRATFVVSTALHTDHPEIGAVGSTVTVDQEEIGDCEILDSYTWPRRREWPARDDPRYAGFEWDECVNCSGLNSPILREKPADWSYEPCRCTLAAHQAKHQRPLPAMVELFNTGTCGIGVRSLQKIAKNEIIGSYVGEIYPSRKKDANVLVPARYGDNSGSAYCFGQYLQRRHRKQASAPVDASQPASQPAAQAAKQAVKSASKLAAKSAAKGTAQQGIKRRAKRIRNDDDDDEESSKDSALAPLADDEYHVFNIDSMVKGNWTRFINHHCDYNTEFQRRNYGMKGHTVIQARQDINFGDEITISYGDEYFCGMKFACKCADLGCRRWNEDNKQNERRTLETVCRLADGPAWARDVPKLNDIWGKRKRKK